MCGAVPAQAMCFQLRDALRGGCIGLSSHFFTLTMEKREMLKLLDDELRNFCILVEAPKTPFGKIKKTYSGKVGGRNDDVVTLHTNRTTRTTAYSHLCVIVRSSPCSWQSPAVGPSIAARSTRTSGPRCDRKKMPMVGFDPTATRSRVPRTDRAVLHRLFLLVISKRLHLSSRTRAASGRLWCWKRTVADASRN